MQSQEQLWQMAASAFPRESTASFEAKVKALADKMVAKNKKPMTDEELEAFKHKCVISAGFELLQEYGVRFTQPKFTSKRYWADVGIRFAANAAGTILLGGLVALVARKRGEAPAQVEVTEETTETTDDVNNPFTATARPSRRHQKTEHVSAI